MITEKLLFINIALEFSIFTLNCSWYSFKQITGHYTSSNSFFYMSENFSRRLQIVTVWGNMSFFSRNVWFLVDSPNTTGCHFVLSRNMNQQWRVSNGVMRRRKPVGEKSGLFSKDESGMFLLQMYHANIYCRKSSVIFLYMPRLWHWLYFIDHVLYSCIGGQSRYYLFVNLIPVEWCNRCLEYLLKCAVFRDIGMK